MKTVLVLVGSPRRNGNSAALAEAVGRGVNQTGAHAQIHFIDDYVSSFLGDCRTCRRDNGECSIDDRYRSLFLGNFLEAEAIVFCSPVYWYGVSAQTKAFFDRSFCYYANAHPESSNVLEKMRGKRIGLVLSSEEDYPGVELGIVHQFQEYARYTHSAFIGVVRGSGNARGEVARDPEQPLDAAETLGAAVFERRYTDYRLETPRDPQVWCQP